MADIQRSISDILTNLFQDGQADGSISAQDIRDLIATMQMSHSSAFISSPTPTIISSSGVFTKALGTFSFAPGITARNFTLPTDNQVTYSGNVRSLINIFITLTLSAGSNIDAAVAIAKNDVVIVSTRIDRALTTNEGGAISLLAAVEMVNTDFLSLYVLNDTSTANVTIDAFYATMLGNTL